MKQRTKDTGQKRSDLPEIVKKFREEFLQAIDSETPSGRALFAFLRTQLRCFRLADYYSEHYILNEVYIRGQSKVGEIRSLRPWIKGTSRLVIRELARKDTKLVHLNEEYLGEQPQEEENWQEHFAALRQALLRLDEMDACLLNLKIVENLSWVEIREVMRVNRYGDVSEATWRKRKERALLRLRKFYHEIMPPF
jgi:DNA-directed RNA polymerase specialized sigma24 family protein